MTRLAAKNTDDSLEFYHRLRACEDQYLSPLLRQSLDTLHDALRLYGPENVLSSYNGGKDADVVMHLLRAACAFFAQERDCECRPRLVYFAIEDEFDEVIQHIDRIESRFDVHLTRYHCGIVQGLKQHISDRHAQGHPAFVLGTRKGDPNCGNHEIFAPSSQWMPVPFMRVNPIMHWEYGHVWHFLRFFNLPYCSLYDQGFTSLGKKSLTLPNPSLLRKDPSLCSEASSRRALSPDTKYWPAYMLADWTLERAGRVSSEANALKQEAADLSAMEQREREQANENGIVKKGETEAERERVRKCDSVALLLIGDELLSGFTTEANLQTTAKALAAIGVSLKAASIVADEVESIAAEVVRLSQRWDVVITSGGIGPTHDDVTLRAVAMAMGQSIEMNAEMVEHLKHIQQMQSEQRGEATPESLDDSTMRLAMLPSNSHLHFPPAPDDMTTVTVRPQGSSNNTDTRTTQCRAWPILRCKNVFVLPGVPQFFANKMHLLVKHFLPRHAVREQRSIVLSVEERCVVQYLDRVVERCPAVKIGSYPFEGHSDFKTILRIEGESAQCVDDAVAELLEELPPMAVLRVEQDAKYDLSI